MGFVHGVSSVWEEAGVLQHSGSLWPLLITVVKNGIQQHVGELVASAEIRAGDGIAV